MAVMARPNTREEIVQAGLKCLVEKGYNAVGVQDITDAAGVPKGSFYNHFDSKEALGLEIVERYGANQTRREILTDPAVPPLQRLRRHFDRITALFVDSHFTRNCILGGFSSELANQSETIREGLRKLYVQWTKDLEATIAEAQANGEIANKTKAADMAAFLLDSYEGALLRARVERSRKPFDRFMKFAFGELLV
jgi:TetR/AcrR family transcriptional regulator, transcriptional repressor for nem operon